MLTEAYGADAMKKVSVLGWHKMFKDGPEDVKDDKRTGRPKTNRTDEKVENEQKLVCSDRRLSLKMMAEELNLDRETVRKILTKDLGMRKVSAKMMTRNSGGLMFVLISLISWPKATTFWIVITGDESWCFQYNLETKCQSMQRKTLASLRPKKAHIS
jgi:hypothetical protein